MVSLSLAAQYPFRVPVIACRTVFVFFRATDGPYISNVHVDDGIRSVHEFNGLMTAGVRTEVRDGAVNYWHLPTDASIQSGLGVSVGVDFADGGEIMFTGAAARLKEQAYGMQR